MVSTSRKTLTLIVAFSVGMVCLLLLWRSIALNEQKLSEALIIDQTFEIVKPSANPTTEGYTTSAQAMWMNEMNLPTMAFTTQPQRIAIRVSQDDVANSEYGPGQFLKTAFPGNTYVPGQCTWYAYNRRYQLGKPIGGFWGNGGGWHYPAARAGFLVNHIPGPGAIIDLPHHVAIVEEVGLDNSVKISEMNYAGPYSYNERWIHNADQYWYIH